jgi:hypothetical protein
MKAPWNRHRLSDKERRQWMLTGRLAGAAFGLAVVLVWAILRRLYRGWRDILGVRGTTGSQLADVSFCASEHSEQRRS